MVLALTFQSVIHFGYFLRYVSRFFFSHVYPIISSFLKILPFWLKISWTYICLFLEYFTDLTCTLNNAESLLYSKFCSF